MRTRFSRSILAAMAIVGFCTARVFAQAPAPAEAEMHALFAERLAGVAARISLPSETDPNQLRQAAAMLDVAVRLAPTEPRHLRALATLRLRLGDTKAAVGTLRQLRQVNPDDQLAQIQTIDLVAEDMETAKSRSDYFEAVRSNEKVPTAVRSHAAVKLAQLSLEQGRDALAKERLDEALKLNDANPTALALKYDLAAATGDEAQRIAALVDLLKMNPADGDRLWDLGYTLWAAGEPAEAEKWLRLSTNVLLGNGFTLSTSQAIDFAALDAINGKDDAAIALLDEIIKLDPLASHAALLRASIIARTGDAERTRVACDVARLSTRKRIEYVSSLMRDPDRKNPATTQPSGAQLVDVASDAATLAKEDPYELRFMYASALSDLASVDQIVARVATPEPVIMALRTLLKPESPLLARVEGWRLLVANQRDEALLKFDAASEWDTLAKLGYALVQQANNPGEAEKAAKAVLAQNRTGPMAVLVQETLRPLNVTPVPADNAAAIHAAASALDESTMSILSSPRNFYTLRAEPLKVTYQFGEPMLIRVTLANVSNKSLALGPGGVIRDAVSIDAVLRAMGNRVLPSTAIAQLTGRVRLEAGESISQIVRADVGEFEEFLLNYPSAAVPLRLVAVTNPVRFENRVVPGPAGLQNEVLRSMERVSFPLASVSKRAELAKSVSQGTPAERFRAMELASRLFLVLSAQEQTTDEGRAVQAQFATMISELATTQTDPLLIAWAKTQQSLTPDVAKRTAMAKELIATPLPAAQIMGTLLCRALPLTDQQTTLAPLLEPNVDPAVREIAGSILYAAMNAPATQPTTQRANPSN